MKFFLLLSLLVAAAAKNVHPKAFYGEKFAAWKAQHGKTYDAASAEHGLRAQTWADHYDHVQTHNKEFGNGAHTFFKKMTQFADMTASEFSDVILDRDGFLNKQKANLRSSHKARKLWGPSPSPGPAPAPVPGGSVDWRTKGAVTPVKNQGQCGSCWTFSATGSIEGANFLATKKLTSFSEQEIVSCCHVNGAQGCGGGIMDSAFEYIVTQGGLDTEASYPYTSGGGASGTCNINKAGIVKNVISGHTDVQTTATALAAAAKQQPTSIAVDASSGWQLYGGGTMSGQCGTSLDHGVLLVGYTPDYWIVKNSWADTWGIDGYIHLSRSDCASQKGECGLYADASFPLTGAALPKYEDLPTMTRVSADFLAKKN